MRVVKWRGGCGLHPGNLNELLPRFPIFSGTSVRACLNVTFCADFNLAEYVVGQVTSMGHGLKEPWVISAYKIPLLLKDFLMCKHDNALANSCNDVNRLHGFEEALGFHPYATLFANRG